MNKENLQIFEELSPDDYCKTYQIAERRFKSLLKFPDSVGFDEQSQGFLVIHKNHADAALIQEIPACLILKKLGFRVILKSESGNQKSVDSKINDLYFEIKRISESTNIMNAIKFQFRTTHHKSDNILVDINQRISVESLKSALILAAKKFTTIRRIWLIYQSNLYQFERKKVASNKFDLK
jgi:hypothetical protein